MFELYRYRGRSLDENRRVCLPYVYFYASSDVDAVYVWEHLTGVHHSNAFIEGYDTDIHLWVEI